MKKTSLQIVYLRDVEKGGFPMRRRKQFFEPPLPFPLWTVETALGPVEVYEIPEEQKAAVLEKLYPGHPIPRLETMMEDGHHNR
jgi:hypothetical protein